MEALKGLHGDLEENRHLVRSGRQKNPLSTVFYKYNEFDKREGK